MGWNSMRRTPDRLRVGTAVSAVISTQVRQDLLEELLGHLGQAVVLPGVPADLLEDAVLGLGGEGGGAPGHHRTARERLHLSRASYRAGHMAGLWPCVAEPLRGGVVAGRRYVTTGPESHQN